MLFTNMIKFFSLNKIDLNIWNVNELKQNSTPELSIKYHEVSHECPLRHILRDFM